MPEKIHVLNRRVRLLQPDGGFRTSLDSVMLAAACPAQSGETVLDLGCGVGGAGFCVMARVPGVRLTGIELQRGYVDLAVGNAALNGHADFIHGDIRDFHAGALFDHVICNPPYLEAGTHTVAQDEGRAMALGHQRPPHPNPLPVGERGQDSDGSDLSAPSPLRGEGRGEGALTLKDWIDCAFRSLKSRGSLTIIHRADAVDRIIMALGKRFGATEIIPLWPYAGEAAKRVIVRSVKDRRSPATLHPGIVLHDENGSTAQAEAILRDAAPI